MIRHREIDGGDTDGAAKAEPVAHRLAEAVSVAQKFGGTLQLPRLYQLADIGGADGDTVIFHLGDDVAA